jgi:hypothetical protein
VTGGVTRGRAAALLAVLSMPLLPAIRLPFFNSDDWSHLDAAAGVLQLDPAAVAWILDPGTVSDMLRPASYPLWVLGYLLAGPEPAIQYAMNVAIVLASAACLWWLGTRFGSPLGGCVAAALFAWNPAAQQHLYFLSAREDGCAALFVLATVVAWRSGRGRTAVLCAWLAMFSKLPGAAAPMVCLLADRVASDRRPLRDYVPLVLPAVGFAVLLLLLASGRVIDETFRGPLQGGLAMLGRRHLVAWMPGVALRSAWPGLPDLLPLLPLLTLIRHPRRASLGLGLTVVGYALALPFSVGQRAAGDLASRYQMLSAAGAALTIGLSLPRGKRWGPALAALAIGGAGAGFLRDGWGAFRTLDEGPTHLLRALRAGEATTALHATLQRPHHGSVALLSCGFLLRVQPRIETVAITLSGGPTFTTRPSPYRCHPWERGDAPPAALSITDRWEGADPIVRTPGRSTPAELPSMSWDLRVDRSFETGWGVTASASGYAVAAPRRLPLERLGDVFAGPPASWPPRLSSPALPGDFRAVCAIEADITHDTAVERARDDLPLRPVALLLAGRDDTDLPARIALQELPPRTGTVRFDLGAAPWKRDVRRIALIPSSEAGQATVSAIRLFPCR